MDIKIGDNISVNPSTRFHKLVGVPLLVKKLDYSKDFPIECSDSEGNSYTFTEDQITISEREKTKALRYNKGKPQFSHLSPDFLLEMMKGMTAANEKYPYLNYANAMDLRTASDSLMRHFLKFQQGSDTDEELSVNHLALVAVNAMIMYQNLIDFGDEVDNRYSKSKEKVQSK